MTKEQIATNCKKYYDSHKEKIKQHSKEYRESHRDQIKEQRKKYREEHRAELAEYEKLYHLKNREKHNEAKREYRQANKERQYNYEKKYREENRERIYVLNQKRKALQMSLPNTFTIDEWEFAKHYFKNRCAYCGSSETALQQEHIIPCSKNGGYTKDNIIPACQKCNFTKNDADYGEWYPKQPFYTKERDKKIKEYVKLGGN